MPSWSVVQQPRGPAISTIPSLPSVLLLHMDGVDASTTFVDSSVSSHTILVGGSAQIDTAQSVFGGASGLFGTSDWLALDGSSDFGFGTGDFTIDFRLRPRAVGVAVFYDGRPTGAEGPYPTIYTDGNNLLYFTNNVSVIIGGAISADTWYHIALTRFNGVTKLFTDGIPSGDPYIDLNDYTTAAFRPLVGNGFDPTSFNANAWVDELRVIKGIAAWTSAFTPPTAPYTT